MLKRKPKHTSKPNTLTTMPHISTTRDPYTSTSGVHYRERCPKVRPAPKLPNKATYHLAALQTKNALASAHHDQLPHPTTSPSPYLHPPLPSLPPLPLPPLPYTSLTFLPLILTLYLFFTPPSPSLLFPLPPYSPPFPFLHLPPTPYPTPLPSSHLLLLTPYLLITSLLHSHLLFSLPPPHPLHFSPYPSSSTSLPSTSYPSPPFPIPHFFPPSPSFF